MASTLARTRVVNRHAEPYDIYIGRGSEWGNPYTHRTGTQAETIVDTREEAIDAYRRDLWAKINAEGDPLLERLARLAGKRLGCYCKPKACHGDVLAAAAEWANEQLFMRELQQVFGAKLREV
jgi:hypothetical protein